MRFHTDPSEMSHLSNSVSSEEVILMHPGFRMFVLANRPGFPFLGNDFFGAMGGLCFVRKCRNTCVASEV